MTETPRCPNCHAQFSIKAGTCTRCGLPEWQFVGIEDPKERGKAIARWRRSQDQPAEIPSRSKKARNKHGRKGKRHARRPA